VHAQCPGVRRRWCPMPARLSDARASASLFGLNTSNAGGFLNALSKAQWNVNTVPYDREHPNPVDPEHLNPVVNTSSGDHDGRPRWAAAADGPQSWGSPDALSSSGGSRSRARGFGCGRHVSCACRLTSTFGCRNVAKRHSSCSRPSALEQMDVRILSRSTITYGLRSPRAGGAADPRRLGQLACNDGHYVRQH
jgi:hypothetical protein